MNDIEKLQRGMIDDTIARGMRDIAATLLSDANDPEPDVSVSDPERYRELNLEAYRLCLRIAQISDTIAAMRLDHFTRHTNTD
ncbi:hypothetical protein [Roseiconus lacunae]|uniref:Uncharacterized protein n=1 Tax=Roseiconus lacunae TaxID=2605694 RepID=A0ABT7PDV4_9BACT|nr:hypothetical protein [Roseiconus lacunae]MDM4014680.1 hypothetical protein [Roseiconus lacunae]